MNIVVWVVIVIVFFYTAGFSITLWNKDKNKLGAIAVFTLALAIIITPFFSILQ